MNILAIVISSLALVLSGYAIYRSGTKPTPAAPTVGTRGAGGGGW